MLSSFFNYLQYTLRVPAFTKFLIINHVRQIDVLMDHWSIIEKEIIAYFDILQYYVLFSIKIELESHSFQYYNVKSYDILIRINFIANSSCPASCECTLRH